jgi:N-methylhydantoinase A
VAEALAATGLPLSLSHLLLPEFREYERMSTVVVNAYLQPLMQRYLAALGDRLGQGAARSPVFVMQSSGGITPLATASAEPVRTVLSGPAGGAIGALRMAARSGCERIISFDMGGTSTDVALLDGKAQTTNEAEVAGLPVRVPMLNIHTVGAGGGSLARFDAGGALRVGPESAGADPGPICYGRGTRPTVTDANLLLGRLQPEGFLGGGFTLDAQRTHRLTVEWLAREAPRLRWKPEQLAEGMIRVVNATMEKAIRVVSIEQGYDPRDFALVAFGGAGPLHACELAAALSIPKVIVPAMPGALSAYGILISDVIKDLSRTVLMRAGTRETAAAERIYRELEATVLRQLKGEAWQGKPRLERSVDMRYAGQGFELNVAWSQRAVADFHAAHLRKYGYAHMEKTVELVNLRLRAVLPQPREATQPEQQSASPMGKSKSTVLPRTTLTGARRSGPAVITEYSATTWIPRSVEFQIDRAGNLVVNTRRPGK